MKKEIDIKGHLNQFKASNYLSKIFNPFSGFYIFTVLPDMGSPYYEHEKFNAQINIIKGFRKVYKIVFPLIIGLAIVGISINELVIDI